MISSDIQPGIPAADYPFSLNYGNSDVRTAVPSRRALAKALGCSEATVARMLIEAGNPGTNLNGSYPLQKWKDYYEARSRDAQAGDDDDAEDLNPGAGTGIRNSLKEEQLAMMRAKRRKAELDLLAREGELVELSEIENAAFTFAAKLAAQHKRSATVDLFNRLMDSFAIDDAAKLITLLEDFHDDFCRKTREFSMKDES